MAVKKMKCISVISVVCCFGIASANSLDNNSTSNNFTFTYTMAMRCKEHLCQHGYSYDTFYRVASDIRKPTSGATFEMHIAILAASNGHILLSTTPHPDASDPVYEIVVGGGANKFSELRRNLRRNARASVKTLGILSSIQFTAFYIRISEDGEIEFGKEGDALPILSYMDVNPIPVEYFSFASWNGVEAKFMYDCPPPGDNETSPDSQEVEPKLSNSELLKRSLLLNRQPYVPPAPTMTIRLGLKITSVRYNAFESQLTTGLAIVTSWTDDKMAWNPSKFNGTTSVMFRQGQIWRPTFFVFNSDDTSLVDTKNPELITMVYSGEATLHFQTQLVSLCDDQSYDFNRWPHDTYTCTILIGPWEPHENITIDRMSSNDAKMRVFADIDEVTQSNWDLSTKQGVVSAGVWNEIFNLDDNQSYYSDRLLINFALTRRATSFNIVFYTPLLVLVSFVLLSFWNEPLQMSRVWFYAGCSIVICMGLCYVDYLVPCHNMPSILVLYTTVLMGVLMALLIHIVLMTSVIEKFCKSPWIQAVLTGKWFRMIFCLPAMKTCRNYHSINEGYDIEEDDSGVMVSPRNGNVEEMQTEATTYGEPVELAEAVDKLLFVVYSVVFAVMLGLHY